VGIDAEILTYDSGAFWSLGIEADGDDWKDLQLFLQKYSSSVDPFDCTAWHTPAEVGSWNWERWSNAEYGELHAAAMVETDMEARRQMYVRMQDLMEESGAFVVIAHELNGALVRDGITPAVDPQFRDLTHMFEKS
jgi:peptide/nickel transport system substrate-binding protein